MLAFHGTPGSRLERHLPDDAYRELGVRYLTVDRPGYGLSDRQPGRSLRDWPADVAALADTLGLASFSLLGVSGGGPFALACAQALPDRVRRVALVSSVGPLDAPGALRGLGRADRLLFPLTRRSPAGAALLWRLAGIVVRAGSWLPAGGGARVLPRSDRPVLTRVPSAWSVLVDISVEAFRGGPWGVVDDYLALSEPWPFAPDMLRVPVALWHGDRDDVVAAEQSRRLARAIPGASLRIAPDAGHLAIFDHEREVLEWLMGDLGGTIDDVRDGDADGATYP